MTEAIQKTSVDGVVFASNRSCKPYSMGQYELARWLRDEHDIPSLVLEADHGDPRSYSSEQGETRIAAFLETLD